MSQCIVSVADVSILHVLQFASLINSVELHNPYTGPKLRFPTMSCPAYQNMTFPHISYTYLAEDRAGFYQTYEMCRKSCPILQISYMYEIQIFVQ